VSTLVAGLDLSIRSTGVCIIRPDWEPGSVDPGLVVRATFGSDDATASDTTRFAGIAESIASLLLEHDFYVARRTGRKVALFVEDYAINLPRMVSPKVLVRLAELGGTVKHACLLRLGVEAVPVTSSTWRKTLLGFARRPDVDVKAVAQERIRSTGLVFATGDECDAFGVANAGRARLGMSFLTFADQLVDAEKGKRRRGTKS
jgi:hypothetical protein